VCSQAFSGSAHCNLNHFIALIIVLFVTQLLHGLKHLLFIHSFIQIKAMHSTPPVEVQFADSCKLNSDRLCSVGQTWELFTLNLH
jgi:hypothetical protein